MKSRKINFVIRGSQVLVLQSAPLILLVSLAIFRIGFVLFFTPSNQSATTFFYAMAPLAGAADRLTRAFFDG